MHNHLGLPHGEERELCGLSLIAVLLAGEPKTLRTWQPYNFGALDPDIYILRNACIYSDDFTVTIISEDDS